eukprot:6725191-Prymnesium_polylepis.1
MPDHTSSKSHTLDQSCSRHLQHTRSVPVRVPCPKRRFDNLDMKPKKITPPVAAGAASVAAAVATAVAAAAASTWRLPTGIVRSYTPDRAWTQLGERKATSVRPHITPPTP